MNTPPLTKAAFVIKPKTERVEIDGVGHVWLVECTEAERTALELSTVKPDGSTNTAAGRTIKAKLLAYSLCDDAGTRLFDAANADDIKQLQSLPASVADAWFDVAKRLCGMGRPDADDTKKKPSSDPNDSD